MRNEEERGMSVADYRGKGDGIDYSDYVASDSTSYRFLLAGVPTLLYPPPSRRPVLFYVNQCGQYALSLTP